MRTISQVAKLTGISTRTLQYYDEIELLQPSKLTGSGYHLYDEANIAKLAIQQFGSIEKFTEAMEHNLEHFSEFMETQLTKDVKKLGKQSDLLYGRLSADLSEDVSSPKVQVIVHEILQFSQKHSDGADLDKPLIKVLMDIYSGDYIKNITDGKYGKGVSDYIVKAFRYYSENNAGNNN